MVWVCSWCRNSERQALRRPNGDRGGKAAQAEPPRALNCRCGRRRPSPPVARAPARICCYAGLNPCNCSATQASGALPSAVWGARTAGWHCAHPATKRRERSPAPQAPGALLWRHNRVLRMSCVDLATAPCLDAVQFGANKSPLPRFFAALAFPRPRTRPERGQEQWQSPGARAPPGAAPATYGAARRAQHAALRCAALRASRHCAPRLAASPSSDTARRRPPVRCRRPAATG